MKHHYVYLITYVDSKYYLGVRSSSCIPSEDVNYLGSSKYTPSKDKVLKKEILQEFPTREEALKEEIRLHALYDVARNPKFYNRARQTSKGFDVTGVAQSKSHSNKIAAALKGRKRSDQEMQAVKKGIAAKLPFRKKRRHSDQTKKKMRESRLGKDGYMKGEIYTDKALLDKAYSSRVKYTEKYVWRNRKTGEVITATARDMAWNESHKYGLSLKPTRTNFNQTIKGVYKSYRGWEILRELPNEQF